MISSHLRAAAPALLAASLLLSACVTPIDRPADCDAAAVEREATLAASGRLEPSTIVVCHDQVLTLTVDVRTDGVLHLHGYDDAIAAQSVTAGTPLTMTFRAVHVGQFVIELHRADATTGTGAGVLTVHDR